MFTKSINNILGLSPNQREAVKMMLCPHGTGTRGLQRFLFFKYEEENVNVMLAWIENKYLKTSLETSYREKSWRQILIWAGHQLLNIDIYYFIKGMFSEYVRFLNTK
jgi:hypothetical protein